MKIVVDYFTEKTRTGTRTAIGVFLDGGRVGRIFPRGDRWGWSVEWLDNGAGGPLAGLAPDKRTAAFRCVDAWLRQKEG